MDAKRAELLSKGYREYTKECFSNKKSAMKVAKNLRDEGHLAQVVGLRGVGKGVSTYIIMTTGGY